MDLTGIKHYTCMNTLRPHARLCVLVLAVATGMCVYAQGTTSGTTASGSTTAGIAPASPDAIVPEVRVVPRSFRNIELGMTMEEVKNILIKDGLFNYRGDPDVSLLPRPNETLIEVSGLSFVKRAFFQFYEEKLFVMIFSLNEKEMDHYSVFTSLSAKYGKPDSLSPSESVWVDAATRMSVERPLAVKYIDMAVFDALKAAGTAQQSYEEVLRNDFLNDF